MSPDAILVDIDRPIGTKSKLRTCFDSNPRALELHVLQQTARPMQLHAVHPSVAPLRGELDGATAA